MKVLSIYGMDVMLSEDNTHIDNSYIIKHSKEMKDFLIKLRELIPDKNYAIHKRSINSMLQEWKAHNILYALGISVDRTKDVDLDIYETWYRKTAYFILSLFYFIWTI